MFKAEFKKQFTGTLSMESGLDTIYPSLQLPGSNSETDLHEVETLRDSTSIPAESMAPMMNEMNEITCALDGAVKAVSSVTKVTPALITPAVATVNEQLKDTADVLGVDAPAALVVNPETMEIDEVSMEGVLDWLGRGLAALGNAIRKIKDRIVIGFHRFGNMSIALKRRVAKSYSMLPRRKHPEGGHPVKLKPEYGQGLVKGEGFSADPIGDLQQFSDMFTEVISIYSPVIAGLESNLSQTFAAIVAYNGKWDGIPLSMDTTASLQQLNALVNKKELFLGNVELATRASKTLLPALYFVPTKPSAEYIFRLAGTPMSLSDETIRGQLLGIQEKIEMSMQGIEAVVDQIGTTADNLISAIARINYADNYRPVQMTGSTAIDTIQVAAKVGQMFNANDLHKLEARVTGEMYELYEIIDRLYETYYQRVGSILALIEESLLQD